MVKKASQENWEAMLALQDNLGNPKAHEDYHRVNAVYACLRRVERDMIRHAQDRRMLFEECAK